METIEQNEKRRNNNLHTLSEIEAAGNVIVKISEIWEYLITRRGDTYTTHTMIRMNGVNYWKPVNATTK